MNKHVPITRNGPSNDAHRMDYEPLCCMCGTFYKPVNKSEIRTDQTLTSLAIKQKTRVSSFGENVERWCCKSEIDPILTAFLSHTKVSISNPYQFPQVKRKFVDFFMPFFGFRTRNLTYLLVPSVFILPVLWGPWIVGLEPHETNENKKSCTGPWRPRDLSKKHAGYILGPH